MWCGESYHWLPPSNPEQLDGNTRTRNGQTCQGLDMRFEATEKVIDPDQRMNESDSNGR